MLRTVVGDELVQLLRCKLEQRDPRISDEAAALEIRKLVPDEAALLRARYGLGGPPHNIAQAAAASGISLQRAQTLERRALRHLRELATTVDNEVSLPLTEGLPMKHNRLLQLLRALDGAPVFVLLGEEWVIAWNSELMLFRETTNLGLSYINFAVRQPTTDIKLLQLESLVAAPRRVNAEEPDEKDQSDDALHAQSIGRVPRDGMHIDWGGTSQQVCGRVKQAIRRALRKIERKSSDLAAHFEEHLCVGHGCITYTPPPRLAWET
jgi:hypothetical protein